jgi:hypothetical protein
MAALPIDIAFALGSEGPGLNPAKVKVFFKKS